MKLLLKSLLPLIDFLASPFVYPAGLLLKLVRMAGVERMPFCKRALLHVGVFPVRNHYYEPLFDCRELKQSSNSDRSLVGIDWNSDEQLKLLESFSFNDELEASLLDEVGTECGFHFNNYNFESGDAEFLYNLIRLKKPARIFEIGSGQSTLVARKAVQKNSEDRPGYSCKHLCVEPYEMPWLEKIGVTVIRQRVEDLSSELFAELDENDLLFIDSSHMIRPQGDILFEYLELLPSLKNGVIVHVHDIFSPRDYPQKWIADNVLFWNEQYLLEAFLTNNNQWKIIGALNWLHHNQYDRLRSVCPYLKPDREPGSFYFQKKM
jgi:predicted O-methyltransferase YrrM